MKKSLLMLAPHEPQLDPRIDWEASMAADVYDVTVVGMHAPSSHRADAESRGAYRIVRSSSARMGDAVSLARAFVRTVSPSYCGRPLVWFMLFYLGLIGVIFFAAVRAVRLLHRAASKLIRGTPLRRVLYEPALRCKRAVRAFIDPQLPQGLFSAIGFATYTAMSGTILWGQIRRGAAPALVHCNDIFALLPGVAAKQQFGCPIVYDSHELWPHVVSASRLHVASVTWYERCLARWADAVVTVSPQLAVEMGRNVRINNVQVVPNAEPWREPRPGDTQTSEDRARDRRVTFLYQGSFDHDRGIAELLEAWRAITSDEAILLLRGPVNSAQHEAREMAGRFGLLDRNVFFPPAVSEDELVSAAREADVALIPYKPVQEAYRYACPNKLSQYMHAGLAIICNDLPYVKEILAEAQCGVSYDSSDISSIRKALRLMIDDAGFREACRRNATDFARRKFNWQNYGTRFLDIYAALIERSGARAGTIAHATK